MKNFKVNMRENTPEIIGNVVEGKISIKGKSFPENYLTFFQPFQDWLDEFYQQDYPQVELNVQLIYMNTTTAIFISNIIKQLSKKENKFVVHWHYEHSDFDMKMSGKDFKDLYGDIVQLHSHNSQNRNKVLYA